MTCTSTSRAMRGSSSRSTSPYAPWGERYGGESTETFRRASLGQAASAASRLRSPWWTSARVDRPKRYELLSIGGPVGHGGMRVRDR